jgi:hypothetical protein
MFPIFPSQKKTAEDAKSRKEEANARNCKKTAKSAEVRRVNHTNERQLSTLNFPLSSLNFHFSYAPAHLRLFTFHSPLTLTRIPSECEVNSGAYMHCKVVMPLEKSPR